MVIIRAASRLCYPHCIYLYIPRKSSKLMLCCFCYCSKGSLHTPLLCVVGKYVVHCIFLSDMQKLCPELLPIWFQLPSWLEVNKDKNFNPNLSQKCWKVLDSSSVSTHIQFWMWQEPGDHFDCPKRHKRPRVFDAGEYWESLTMS